MTVVYSNLGDIDCKILQTLWKGVKGVKVLEIKYGEINDGIEEEVEKVMSEEEDTIIFAGHGTSFGFPLPILDDFHYVLYSSNSDMIKAKRIICFWCRASIFCWNNELGGSFSTSMYISNTEEAKHEGLGEYSQRSINRVHGRFCRDLRELILGNKPMEEWVPILQSKVDPNNEVDKFNRGGLEFIPPKNT